MADARVFVLLLGITASFAQLSSRTFEGRTLEGRILVGQDAASGEFPWVASVRLDNVHVGVGVIVSKNYVLTAGHCVSEIGSKSYAASRISVRVGSTNQYASGEIVGVNRAVIHEKYGNFMNDLALLELKTPLEWTTKIQSIELASAESQIPDDSEVIVTGWGLQLNGATPYKLQHTKLRIISPPDCEFSAGYGYEASLCLAHRENQGICRGDDGAPAVFNNQLVGVASFSFGDCGTKFPDIFSRVSYFRDWIDRIIN